MCYPKSKKRKFYCADNMQVMNLYSNKHIIYRIRKSKKKLQLICLIMSFFSTFVYM